jgi:hypothetical protein
MVGCLLGNQDPAQGLDLLVALAVLLVEQQQHVVVVLRVVV